MVTAPLTPLRRLALGLALPCCVFLFVFQFYSLQVRHSMPPFHWHFAAQAAWIGGSAVAGGLVITELLRSVRRSWGSWSGNTHFRIALTLSFALVVIQSFGLWVALRCECVP